MTSSFQCSSPPDPPTKDLGDESGGFVGVDFGRPALAPTQPMKSSANNDAGAGDTATVTSQTHCRPRSPGFIASTGAAWLLHAARAGTVMLLWSNKYSRLAAKRLWFKISHRRAPQCWARLVAERVERQPVARRCRKRKRQHRTQLHRPRRSRTASRPLSRTVAWIPVRQVPHQVENRRETRDLKTWMTNQRCRSAWRAQP